MGFIEIVLILVNLDDNSNDNKIKSVGGYSCYRCDDNIEVDVDRCGNDDK